MCGYRKNLTHLQTVLLFKDSRVLDLSGENFIASAAKAEATVRRKARKREIFIGRQGVTALDHEKSAAAR
jgi:hypothetical protein